LFPGRGRFFQSGAGLVPDVPERVILLVLVLGPQRRRGGSGGGGGGGGGSGRYSPKRRSYSRSPARGASGTTVGGGQAISPRPSGYDAPANTHEPGAPRW